MKKIITRFLLGLLALLALAALSLAALIVYDVAFPSQRVTDFTNVTYPGTDDTTLRAYLAHPKGQGNSAAVLMVHEFYGINADIVKKADLLADLGYTVLAVDAYRGQTSRRVPRAIWLVVSTPREQIQTDIAAGFNYLAGLPGVDASRIGAVGFCFGGTQVMHMATRNPALRATVIYYGNGPITDPAALGVMGESGPVLGIYGEKDGGIPLKQVRGFEMALNTRGVSNKISIYPGVGHAFVHYDTIQAPGPALNAWNEMLDFLAANLKG
jgi:carboxymethylenebutenolidase